MSRSRQRSSTCSSSRGNETSLGSARKGADMRMPDDRSVTRFEPITRALIGVAVALAALIGGLGLAVYLTRDEDNIAVDNVLAEKLTKAIQLAQPNGEDVNLARQTSFGWDHVLLV